jgi:hypothetical protein
MKIYNFEHSYTRGIHLINDFKVEITNEHIENLALLSQPFRKSYGFEQNGEPVVKSLDAQKGAIVETAKVLDYSPQKAKLYPESSPMTDIDDLCLVLSLLTGRFVVSENALEEDIPLRKTANYLSPTKFIGKMNLDIDAIARNDLSESLYSIVLCICSKDLGAQAFYANAALNNVFEKWAVSNGKSKFDKNKVEKIRKWISELLQRKIEFRIKRIALSVFGDSKESLDIISGFRLRDQPSALFKMAQFFESIGVLKPDRDHASDERLKLLNRARNSFVHAGSLPKIKKIQSFEKIAQITSACIQITQIICTYYFISKILQINDLKVEGAKGTIESFFDSGKFNDTDVFSENFEEYLKRSEKEFIEKYGGLYREWTSD